MTHHDVELRNIYALIGEIATTWSEVELMWYLIFTIIMKDTPRKQAEEIFFMFETSNRHRELIMAVADAAYPCDEHARQHPLRRKLGQLHARTNELAGDRNAAIHGVVHGPRSILVGDFTMLPGPNPDPKKRNKFAGKALTDELQASLEKIKRLYEDLQRFRDANGPPAGPNLEMLEALQRLKFRTQPWIVPPLRNRNFE